MLARTETATVMSFRDQRRRPLVGILVVVVPAVVIVWSVALTQAIPRRIGLPGGAQILTTMKALHGPGMASLSVAFVAALLGVFVTQSALQGDRRLVAAGMRPGETILARLAVLSCATVLLVAVSAAAMAASFTPASWAPVIAALILTGLIYAAIGSVAGALLDKLAATYLLLFLSLTDTIVQSPMFHSTPGRWAILLPGYAPTRILIDGSFSPHFHATSDLLFAFGWVAALAVAVYLVLRRTLGART
jgi:hypothetical protein